MLWIALYVDSGEYTTDFPYARFLVEEDTWNSLDEVEKEQFCAKKLLHFISWWYREEKK